MPALNAIAQQTEATLFDPRVSIIRTEADYPANAPFHPDTDYPEYPFWPHTSEATNPVYGAVRETLRSLNLDAEHYGRRSWNPLGEIVQPHDRVIIKPNYVLHTHFSNKDFNCVVTHTSVLRAIIDYVLKALGPAGSVAIADAPLRDADFEELVRKCQLTELQDFYRQQGCEVDLIDMRLLKVEQRDGFVVKRDLNLEQKDNSRIVDIGAMSEFAEIESLMPRLAGADYDRRVTRRHHSAGRHEYRVSQHILDADVVINVGKLKTHKKSGVTLSMKNMVGINVDKNFLPHYRIGMPSQGGDEFPERGTSQKLRQWLIRKAIDGVLVHFESLVVPVLRSILKRFPRAQSDGYYAKEYASRSHPGYNQMMIERFYSFILGSNIRDGNWQGNDTAWRMILDLNKILLYCDRHGRLGNRPARRYFSFIDGIIGGEGDGPTNPAPVKSGVILAGFNPVSVDWCAVQIMGFDPQSLPVLTRSRNSRPALGPESRPSICGNFAAWSGEINRENSLRFKPHSQWSNIILKDIG